MTSNLQLEIIGSKFYSTQYYDANGPYVKFEGQLKVVDTEFRMANADFGGAIFSTNVERLEVTQSTFKYNKARVQGGAIYLDQLGS